jgi:hypothetical protein
MRVKVNTSGTSQVVGVGTQGTNQVVGIGIQGPAGPNATLATLPDINVTNLQNGSMLVYSEQTQKWVSTTTLESQNMEGGFF